MRCCHGVVIESLCGGHFAGPRPLTEADDVRALFDFLDGAGLCQLWKLRLRGIEVINDGVVTYCVCVG